MNRRRLDAESVRDAVLAVSGKLDLTMGGPGFELFRFKDDHSPIYDHEAADRINAPECRRRTSTASPSGACRTRSSSAWTAPTRTSTTPVRNTTITALQALALLNDPFMIRQSEAFAARLEAKGGDRAAQVEAAFVLAFGRPPRDEERRALVSLRRAARAGEGVPGAVQRE